MGVGYTNFVYLFTLGKKTNPRKTAYKNSRKTRVYNIYIFNVRQYELKFFWLLNVVSWKIKATLALLIRHNRNILVEGNHTSIHLGTKWHPYIIADLIGIKLSPRTKKFVCKGGFPMKCLWTRAQEGNTRRKSRNPHIAWKNYILCFIITHE